ncbi:hypothetical protein LVD15_17650 [Fulvivirga maritima]|uniref:hypothetical protein n=1 Tax=Fulvivirga maritima TaxID=2904247 RepID=UPI001F1E89AA|nr:hypothetical protein [Fulvivirga maritima]UII25121.1 hypothetical protein LVD15_17650 [Fulvivirga maritima]
MDQNEFAVIHKKTSELLVAALERYNQNACQCAYPRFQQLIGIDCTETGDAFHCYDTELLINLSKKYFNIGVSNLNNENANEKWTCKKCQSVYEYGWQDFSIAVERQKLELVELKAKPIGKEASKPIPLYLGLAGHTYPPRTEIDQVSFEEFESYLMEKDRSALWKCLGNINWLRGIIKK